MAGRKRRAECEHGESHYSSIHHKQSCSNDLSVEMISEYEEVESCLNHAFEYVDEHRVKTEFAPLLRAIFDKYGDISRGNDIKSYDLVSIFLERICYIYQRLEQAEFVDLTRVELQGMICELRHFERHKLKVRWILERVECKSIELMEKDLEAYERQVCCLQQKISSTKAELAVMHKARNDQMKQQVAASGVIALDEEQEQEQEQGGADENRGEVRAAVRRSTRPRKEPGWHKAFCLLYTSNT